MKERTKCFLGSIIIVFILLCCSVEGVYAAVYYVKNGGAKTSGASIPDNWENMNCYRNIQTAIDAMAGGDEVIVDDGTYYLEDGNFINDKNFVAVPSGISRNNFTVVRAKNRLKVRLQNKGGLNYYDSIAYLTGKYIQVDGFVGVLSDTNYPPTMFDIGGSYNKITNCIGVRKGVADNYTSVISLRGSYNLAEDCAATGHSRYLFFTGGPDSTDQYNIFRRCIARTDYSDSNQPMAGFSFYGNNGGTNTNNMIFQNCFAIDGHQMNTGYGVYSYAWGGFYFPKNAYQAKIQGCIVLNQDSQYGGFSPLEAGGGEISIEHSVSWGNYDSSAPGTGEALNLRGSGSGIHVGHCTFGGSDNAITNGNSGIASTKTLTNNLFWKNSNIGRVGTWGIQSYNAFFPLGQSLGSNSVTADTLSYIVRVESGSSMAASASDGKDIGARIVKRYGAAGSFFGEAGYDLLQDGSNGQGDVNLWPWPNEDMIKTIFSEPNPPNTGAVPITNNTTRGFCATGARLDGKSPITLTSYVWEYLGNPIPTEIYMSASPTIKAIKIQ